MRLPVLVAVIAGHLHAGGPAAGLDPALVKGKLNGRVGVGELLPHPVHAGGAAPADPRHFAEIQRQREHSRIGVGCLGQHLALGPDDNAAPPAEGAGHVEAGHEHLVDDRVRPGQHQFLLAVGVVVCTGLSTSSAPIQARCRASSGNHES
ncbi:hypothetical protein GCM10018954_060010 [Kutzneria kofuensis]